MMLSKQNLEHYSRQIMLSAIGEVGQEKLLLSKVAIFGLGGLGSPASMYLTAAGIGELHLIDYDDVETSNMQRQLVHRWHSAGELKVESAQNTLHAINPNTDIEINFQVHLRLEQYLETIDKVDYVLDCTDNFDARFKINQACHQLKKPLVSGAAIRMEGQVTSFDFRKADSACYQCLYPETGQAETCAEHGILAPVVGIIGSMQALEAIKFIVDLPVLSQQLLLFDAVTMEQRLVGYTKDSSCGVCGSSS